MAITSNVRGEINPSKPFLQLRKGIIFVVVLIYVLGWATTKVLGRRFLEAFDNIINRIPLAKGIYGTLKQLLGTLQQKLPRGSRQSAHLEPGPESHG